MERIKSFFKTSLLGGLIVIGVVISACFVVGVFVRTRLGALIYRAIEKRLLGRVPGYSLIKETVLQFLGG